MIMKANKQIGFIYKNEESIDKILKDGEVVFERGFLREKTSTTLPITFGGVGKYLKDYRVYGNTYQNSTSGKNLLDDKNITSRQNCTVNNGVITTTPLARANLVYVNINDIPLKAGDELYTTFKVRLKSGNASMISYGGRLYNGTTYATNTRLTDNHVSNEFIIYSVKQTVSTDIIANQMVFQAENAAGVSDAVYEIKDIIVSTNPIDTYEEYTGGQPSPNPDYPQEMVSCGDLITDTTDINYGKYKIPVNVNNVITNIYLDEPLRKIDEYSDYIDFINGKVVRNIKEYTLIGDEQIKMIRRGMNCIKIDGKNIRTEPLTMPPIFCNMLLANNRDSIYQGNVGIGYGAINNGYYNDIVMRVPNITTLTDFTTWLQSNNVIVDYVLETPTEESITLPNIPTIDGNNTLNIETEITPSQVYIKYKSNE